MKLSTDVMDDIKRHAEEEAPAECCGLIVDISGVARYFRAKNLSSNQSQFRMCPNDYIRAEDAGTIVAIVHSHPFSSSKPSMADRVSCEESGIPWLIVSYPIMSTTTIYPESYEAPLIGRPYVHGVLDCFTIIRDYYRQNLGIHMDMPVYDEFWWTRGENHYVDNYESYGFIRLSEGSVKRPHDVALMCLRSKVPNHGGVITEKGYLLHHPFNSLSVECVFGGFWEKCSTHLLRHKDLM